ncbi:hypothetical protein [Natronobacterium gregoryi]|uniref:Uncharacterized protein n=2 Tax=Natronobacterium gregoryi TaxID=44930 RepID=L0AIG6_NATGS|nr:hypothetical protein [Natronobacterium gregoryi]AFZ73673.1 hypothetical protein Natgr_2510 [Natronobacterium gregoryi SP2]ELY67867.1 hypothetical protein C490_10675 [Natronobacterium gregoryi SP2]PLK19601.1 hypothetical protein CYV19_13815 [Natronobacterium gregoryi SP2]SFJ00733.1 hypothetical protein SAMN05443661_11139 [Natronobacterium gregoryi]
MPSDRGLASERALARTYHSRSYTDAYEAVEDYRRVTQYASDHPRKGSGAVSTALELPRSRIRPWLDDSKPNPVRAIETARNYGWLECTYDSPAFDPLNTLVASVFSGGSITADHYQPSFPLDDQDNRVVDALELTDVEYEIIEDRDGRADEVRPTDDGTVLGRVLTVLGAPTGPKAAQPLSLPSYLEDAPADVRKQFVDVYLEHRAVEYRGKDTLCIQEQRNREYLAGLAALLDDVADGGVALRERHIIITAAASRRLDAVN